MNKEFRNEVIMVYRLFHNVVMVDGMALVKVNGIYTTMGQKEPNGKQWTKFFEFLHQEYNKKTESQIAVNKLLRELNIQVISNPN